MRWQLILVIVTALLFSGDFCLAACPSADLNGDCFLAYEDFAPMANRRLPGDPCIPDDMAYIPPGTFQMGDSFNEGDEDERPVHTVLLDSFYIGKYKITNQQYCDYLNSAKSQGLITVTSGRVYKAGSGTSYPYCSTSSAPTGNPDYGECSQITYSAGVFSVRTKGGRSMSKYPMVIVTWYGAAAYCNWRSWQEGYQESYNLSAWNCDFSKKGYRLATEAQWEYAARGGLSGRRFPGGDTVSQTQANFYSSSTYPYDVSPVKNIYHPLWNDGVHPYTSPVVFFDGTMKYKTDCQWIASAASYQTISGANSYGLYDMTGNVWEWCNDWYLSSYYSSSPTNNPTGPTSGPYHVLRGGSWLYDAFLCRVAIRHHYRPAVASTFIGFRVVLDLE